MNRYLVIWVQVGAPPLPKRRGAPLFSREAFVLATWAKKAAKLLDIDTSQAYPARAA